jgi:hypothetical protein
VLTYVVSVDGARLRDGSYTTLRYAIARARREHSERPNVAVVVEDVDGNNVEHGPRVLRWTSHPSP